MQSIDTNVLVRLLVQDDEQQCSRAEALLRRALEDGGILIGDIVLVEVVWVLRKAYRFERTQIANVLRNFIRIEGVFVEERGRIDNALAAFETGSADFSDYLILESARRADALPLWTFDHKLSAAKGAQLVP